MCVCVCVCVQVYVCVNEVSNAVWKPMRRTLTRSSKGISLALYVGGGLRRWCTAAGATLCVEELWRTSCNSPATFRLRGDDE